MALEVTKAQTELEDMDSKHQQAMVLTGGNEVLSKAVMNVDRYKNNAWKTVLIGPVDPLRVAEWSSVTTSGFGNQKK